MLPFSHCLCQRYIDSDGHVEQDSCTSSSQPQPFSFPKGIFQATIPSLSSYGLSPPMISFWRASKAHSSANWHKWKEVVLKQYQRQCSVQFSHQSLSQIVNATVVSLLLQLCSTQTPPSWTLKKTLERLSRPGRQTTPQQTKPACLLRSLHAVVSQQSLY